MSGRLEFAGFGPDGATAICAVGLDGGEQAVSVARARERQ